MRRYNLAVLGISETHWTQAGQKRLAMGEMLLYSGHEEENAPHTQGVALILSKVARNPLVGWESHGSRIIKASFKTKEGITMNIIQCYAPNNDSNDDIKDQFYERMQSIIEKCPRKDLTEIQQQRNRWVEYFGELLNRPAPMNPPDIEAAHTDLPIDVNPPTTEEIRMAIRQIKDGKANQLDDLDFADDTALLSHTHEQMQIKTASVAAVSASVGINMHKGKTKVLKFKTENSNPITLDGETLEDVESFTYLGSIIDEQGGSDADVKARIGKARAAFLQLKNI
ncbi:unnamed protein product [Schistosoma margrebowiei]|uniref:Uncharacterized protein n=1 Tax=Schistosoma margrebowiei TaxID=48269 RepID=A0A183MQG6_9TREM|nr:unnamed protein product [Schistosoma margrebowiei]